MGPEILAEGQKGISHALHFPLKTSYSLAETGLAFAEVGQALAEFGDPVSKLFAEVGDVASKPVAEVGDLTPGRSVPESSRGLPDSLREGPRIRGE